jgi:hypothetical protein
MKIDYEAIKAMAKQKHMPITELIALAPANDPFYTGTPRDLELGHWFAELWQRFGYRTGVHIRRMHYAIVSQNPPVQFPNGKPYENTESCWNELTNAAKAARYLELVDPAAFVDRRNDDPIDHVNYWSHRFITAQVETVDDSPEIQLPELPSVPAYNLSYGTQQRYHLEIWCEKSTMNDILEPLARRYDAAIVYGKGELSITMALQAIERFKRTGRPVRIFYVSDFDPAGAGMPVSMSRKLEYFVRHEELDLDIKLFPVVLTYAQTKQYSRLLPTPIKETERRKDKFEAKYGAGAIELDALEALYPGELARILGRELSRYYDKDLGSRMYRAISDIRETLRDTEREVYAVYTGEIEAINDEWQSLQEAFKKSLADHMARRTELYQRIESDLADDLPEVSEDDIPEAEDADERNGALYDSHRGYLEQNDIYQAHKANMSNLDA